MKGKNEIKNICIYIGQLHFGGAEKQSIILAKALGEKYTVKLLVFKGHKLEKQYAGLFNEWDISYHLLKGSFFKRIAGLYSQFRRSKFDMVFCYLPADNVIGTLIGRLAGVRYIIGGIRNIKIVKKKFPFMKFMQNRFQDHIIFNSQAALENYCDHGYKKEKSMVIGNAVFPKEYFHIRPAGEVIKILIVGRFVRQKDYETAIKSIAYLYDELNIKNIRFVIAGFGEMEGQIREWLVKYNIGKISEIRIRPANINELYEQADIFLNTSVFEGLSNSIMEAMSNGLPVVATNAGDVIKLLKNGINGFIADIGDYRSIAEKLRLLCGDREKRIEYGKAAHKHIVSNYSFECFKKQYFEFISTLN